MDRIALITGSNRGIGFEVARQLAERGFRVIITSRSAESARETASKIGDSALAHPLDVADQGSIAELAAWLKNETGRLDVLVNNAGILLDEKHGILDTPPEAWEKTLRTNALGPLLMTQALCRLLGESDAPRVVNVSSGAGQISSMTSYAPAYSISKAALNATTVMLSKALPNAKVNSVDPGWVRTDMGGPHATRSVEEGADTIVWLATLPDDGPTGGYFRDRKRISW